MIRELPGYAFESIQRLRRFGSEEQLREIVTDALTTLLHAEPDCCVGVKKVELRKAIVKRHGFKFGLPRTRLGVAIAIVPARS